LEGEDKEAAVTFAMGLVERKVLDTSRLYRDILTPAMNNMSCQLGEESWCIWKEHVRTSIVRTIIECCYPFIMIEREGRAEQGAKGNVLIVCPQEEYHELGARMVSDLFTLSGFNSIFIGANTPEDEIMSAIGFVKPKYLGISASSSYSLFAVSRLIERIRKEGRFDGVRIIVGGVAFSANPNVWEKVGADLCVNDLNGIRELE
ncbi:MAG TPA: cobalamin-dependent protein, partial [Methanomassiliicoccales archaeon]|nr:cobalamin-dependent protein [Methanomassiliicoccales archaeon]